MIFSSVLNIIDGSLDGSRPWSGRVRCSPCHAYCTGDFGSIFVFDLFMPDAPDIRVRLDWFDGQELRSMLRIAVPSVLQQSTVSIGMMIVQAVVNPFGTQALAGYAATMRVENVFSLIFVSIGNAVSPYVSQNLGAKKIERIKKGYHAALVLDLCFAVLAFIVIETLHTQISSLFLGKDGTALAYQVSGDYMRWLGYLFHFYGYQDGNRWSSSGTWNHASISHCKYGKSCNSSVSCFDFCTAFWYCICLACCTGWLACKFSDFLCGTQKIMAG